MLTDSQIIDALGGNRAVAKLCAPTITAVVSGWRKRGIPTPWRKFLQVSEPHVFKQMNTKENANNPNVVFLKNLNELMDKYQMSTATLSIHSGVSIRMIDYILKKERHASVEIIDAIGMAFELEAWEMLHPQQGDIA
jgi:hypothetical protein